MKLAEKLGMSLQETKSKISSSEFTLWKVYFQEEHTRFHREDYFFAMLTAEVRRTVAKHPEKVKMEDFLLDFSGGDKKKTDKSKLIDKEQETAVQKSFWLGMVGLDPDDPHGEKEKS